MVTVAPTEHVQRFFPVGSARDVIRSRDFEVIAAGPAGTGKTLAICWKFHLAAHRYPGMRALFARQTLEALKKGALTTYANAVRPQDSGVRYYGGSNARPAAYIYPNGSVIELMSLEDPEKVKSAEYDMIYVNEVTESPEPTWQILRSRCRNFRMPYQQIVGDCNPAGPKHWILARSRSGKLTLITSTHRDNPAYWNADRGDWTEQGRQYVEGVLASLTGVERDRLYLGKWAAPEGLVYPDFVPEMVHREDVTGWRTVMACDIGSRNPTAILTLHVAGDERVHVSREVYRREMTSSDILDAIGAEADGANPDRIWIDPSAKGVIGDLRRKGYPVVGANNDVLEGIRRVRSVLADGFSVDPDCVNLIDEFGMYAYPRNAKLETDKPEKDHDHAMDALRYGVMGALNLRPRRKPGVY